MPFDSHRCACSLACAPPAAFVLSLDPPVIRHGSPAEFSIRTLSLATPASPRRPNAAETARPKNDSRPVDVALGLHATRVIPRRRENASAAVKTRPAPRRRRVIHAGALWRDRASIGQLGVVFAPHERGADRGPRCLSVCFCSLRLPSAAGRSMELDKENLERGADRGSELALPTC